LIVFVIGDLLQAKCGYKSRFGSISDIKLSFPLEGCLSNACKINVSQNPYDAAQKAASFLVSGYEPGAALMSCRLP
jgi:hypothetical protein